MRCLSTGSASAITSSIDGASRPSSSARARATSISACEARGLGPQAISLPRSPASGPGRAERTSLRIASTTDSPTGRRRTRRCAAIRSSAVIAAFGLGFLDAGGLEHDAPLGGRGRDSRRRSASGSGRAALRAADRCPPARSGSASPARGTASGTSWRAPATVTCCSCIACSSADWVRGLARLISSAISSWPKIGPGMKRKARLPPGAFLQHFAAEDVGGHQVGRELDAPGVEAEHGAERLDQLGLGEAGHADQHAVAAGQDGDQRVLDHLLLAEDHRADAVLGRGDVRGRGLGGADDHVFELLDSVSLAIMHSCCAGIAADLAFAPHANETIFMPARIIPIPEAAYLIFPPETPAISGQ